MIQCGPIQEPRIPNIPETARSPESSDRRLLGLSALAVSIVVFLVFSRAVRGEFLNWDDDVYLLGNAGFRGLDWIHLRWMFTTFTGGFYMPLVWLSDALDCRLWGLSAAGFHLTNVLLHSLNAAVFCLLSARLLKAARPQADRAGVCLSASLAALLFALHPLRVQSVAWVFERKDVLCCLFYLLALLIYVGAPERASDPLRRRRALRRALGCFLLSLLSKTVSLTLPLVLVLLDVYPLKRLPSSPRRWSEPRLRALWKEKWPFFALSALAAALTVYGQVRAGAVSPPAVGRLAAVPARAAIGLAFYLGKTILPVSLHAYYSIPRAPGALNALGARAAVFVFAVGALAWLSRRRWPWFGIACLYYVATAAPILGLVPFGAELVAERYSLLPCMGWAVVAGAVLLTRRPLRVFLALLLVAALGAATWRQIGFWRDSASLWSRAAGQEPDAAFVRFMLGNALNQRGDRDGALREYGASLALNPDDALAHFNLGSALLDQGNLSEAAAHFQEAMRLNPELAGPDNAMGLVLARQGDMIRAASYFSRALDRGPNDVEALSNRAAALIPQGKVEEAIPLLIRALALDPGHANARRNLELALRARERAAPPPPAAER